MSALRVPRIRVAAVLPHGDSLLLVRHQKNSKRYWMLPGGGLDYGESFEDCAVREIHEETGLEITVDRVLYLSEAIDPRGSRHVVNIYVLGRILGGTLAVPANDVIDSVEFMPVVELSNIVLYPPIAQHLITSHQEGYQAPIQNFGAMWLD